MNLLMTTSCGTIASFKTAKLTSSESPEITAGLTTHSVPFQNKADPNDKEVRYTSVVLPEFAIWARLGDMNSKYDAGVNFSIPIGIQGTIRRHIIYNSKYTPETTIGILARYYNRDILLGDPVYTTNFIDVGVPLYIDWDLPIYQESSIYINVSPTLRRYTYKTKYGGVDEYDYNETIYGVQITTGLKIYKILVEYNLLVFNDKKIHTQAGIAYVF